MKTLNFEQMEQVNGGRWWHSGTCNFVVGLGVGLIGIAAGPAAPFASVFIGATLGVYASNAFC